MLAFLASSGDRLILGRLLSLEQLGLYTVAFFFAQAIVRLVSGLGTRVLFPALSELSREFGGRADAADDIWLRLRRQRSIRRGNSESRYVSGRDIGDEYRYILERRIAPHFPGNLLTRPALLLNPWALRDTQTTLDRSFGSLTGGGPPSLERI